MQMPLHNVLNSETIAQVLNLLRSAPAGEGWISGLVTTGKESEEAARLTGTYHNLLRMWAKP